jgi:chemotaxis protein MotA
MDLTTILGIVGGFVLIVKAIMDGGNLSNFIDPPSVLITVGGAICAMIASYPFNNLVHMGAHFTKLLSNKKFRVEPVIEEIVEFAQIARTNGLLALEEKANALADPFFKQGVLLVVDAMEPDKVREMMENEVASMMARHEEEASIYDKLGSYAPAFGMIGTLVGLINMLASMDMSSGSAGSLGSSMATAMITTFYGCILANLICAPIAKKLRIRTEEEVLYKQIIIEGVIGIQSGENPKNIKEKLVSLLHQKRQQKLLTDGGGDKKGKK